MPPDIEAIAEQVFTALADPSRRAILAALASGGPATATDLASPADHAAGDRETPGPAGQGRLGNGRTRRGRRVRYRLRSAPMQVAQQFLAALARDWDRPLEALTEHLDRSARGPTTTTPLEEAPGRPCLIADSPPLSPWTGTGQEARRGLPALVALTSGSTGRDGSRADRHARARRRSLGCRRDADERHGHGGRNRTRFVRALLRRLEHRRETTGRRTGEKDPA